MEGTLDSLLRGRLDNLPPLESRVIRVFISSTFSDTVKERNALMRDVYPQLKDFCKALGLEFQVVDMRWGVREEAQDDHMTSALCIREINKCKELSAGPTFVALLGQKYGYRPFPATISAEEFEKIKRFLQAEGKDTSLLETWYQCDLNESCPIYRLQQISSMLKNYINTAEPRLMEADRATWWQVFAQIQSLLRDGAKLLKEKGIFTKKETEKYFISVTEEEISTGLLSDMDKSRQLVIEREIIDMNDNLHQPRAVKFTDLLDGGEIDREAETLLKGMKEEKIQLAVQNEAMTLTYKVNWAGSDGIDENIHCEYLSKLCQDFYAKMTKLIERSRTRRNELEKHNDGLVNEVLHHLNLCKSRCDIFIGREDILNRVQEHLSDLELSRPLIIHGESGSGKTSIIAKAAMLANQMGPSSPNVIIRFLGTSGHSSNVINLLTSVCNQICALYNLDVGDIPTDINPLVKHFKDLLKKATSESPLVLLLDSLDQLASNQGSLNLSWIPTNLPPNVHMILSVLTNKDDILKRLTKAGHRTEQLVEVPALGEEMGYNIVRKWLGSCGRKLTKSQDDTVQDVFRKCSLPLNTKLVFDEIRKWPSYMSPEKAILPSSMKGIINMLLQRTETQHGQVLVSHALSYITISKNGLSELELEDVLSLDDDVLSEVFSFWLPPVRRLPPLLWTRIQEDLNGYFVNREGNGVTVLSWYHRQFIEVAKERYLTNEDFKKKLHSNLADYFLGTWVGKEKPFVYKPFLQKRLGLSSPNGQADRKVGSQPLFWSAADGMIQYNNRKLGELPHHLFHSNRLKEYFKLAIFSYDWINAKVRAGSLPELLGDITLAMSQNADSSKQLCLLSSALKMAATTLVKLPQTLGTELIARLKDYAETGSDLDQLVQECEKKCQEESGLQPLFQCYETPDDSLVCPLVGHTARVNDLVFSADCKQLYSVSENGDICIWDVDNGELLQRVDISFLNVDRHAELHLVGNLITCELYAHDPPLLVIDPDVGLVNKISLVAENRAPGPEYIHDTIARNKLVLREGEVIDVQNGKVLKALDFLTQRKDYVAVALTNNEKYILFGEKDATRMVEIMTEKVCAEIHGEHHPSQMVITQDDRVAVIGYAFTCLVIIADIDLNSSSFGEILFSFDYKNAFPDFKFPKGRHYCQEVSEIVLSHRGEKVALNLKYCNVFVLRIADYKTVMLKNHSDDDYIKFVKFSSDDKCIVGRNGNKLCVWCADTGQILSTLDLNGSPTALATSPSKNLLATVTTSNQTIKVFDIHKLQDSGKTINSVYDNPLDTVLVSPQTQLAFIKTYRRLDSLNGYHFVDHFGLDVWDLCSFKQKIFLPFDQHGSLQHSCMSADGQTMALCTSTKDSSHVFLVKVKSGDLCVHVAVQSKVKVMTLSPKGDYIMLETSSSTDVDMLEIYDGRTGKSVLSVVKCHSGAFSYDSEWALWVEGKTINMLSLTQGIRDKIETKDKITGLSTIPSRPDLVVATKVTKGKSKVMIYNISTKNTDFILEDVSTSGLIDFAKNGSVAVDGNLQVFDLVKGVMITQCQGHSSGQEFNCVKLTDSGSHVLWACTDPVHCIKVYSVYEGNVTAIAGTHSPVKTLNLLDSGFKVIVGCADGHFLAFYLGVKARVSDTIDGKPENKGLSGSIHGEKEQKVGKLKNNSLQEEDVELPTASSDLSQLMQEKAKQVHTVRLTGASLEKESKSSLCAIL